MNGTSARKPVWPWILGGCLFLIVAAIVGVAVLWQVGTSKLVRNVEENLKNPKLREEKALRMLHAKRLPAGYYPVSGTFEFPLITHVRLSDRPPDSYGSVIGYDKAGFIYTDSLHTNDSAEVERFFTESGEVMEKLGIRVRAKEAVATGKVGGIRYRTVRGRVDDHDEEAEGLVTLMWIECAGTKKREKTAIWFGPDPGPDAPLTGTVADEAAIRAFMAHFDLCAPR